MFSSRIILRFSQLFVLLFDFRQRSRVLSMNSVYSHPSGIHASIAELRQNKQRALHKCLHTDLHSEENVSAQSLINSHFSLTLFSILPNICLFLIFTREIESRVILSHKGDTSNGFFPFTCGWENTMVVHQSRGQQFNLISQLFFLVKFIFLAKEEHLNYCSASSCS